LGRLYNDWQSLVMEMLNEEGKRGVAESRYQGCSN